MACSAFIFLSAMPLRLQAALHSQKAVDTTSFPPACSQQKNSMLQLGGWHVGDCHTRIEPGTQMRTDTKPAKCPSLHLHGQHTTSSNVAAAKNAAHTKKLFAATARTTSASGSVCFDWKHTSPCHLNNKSTCNR